MMTELNIKTITATIAVLTLLFTAYKFYQVQAIEAAKPYLEKKLEWCEEAVETASYIANSEKPSKEKKQRFWELYWGVLGMVERDDISKAMIEYGKALEANEKLTQKSLDIAHACRKELSNDWSPSWSR